MGLDKNEFVLYTDFAVVKNVKKINKVVNSVK